MASLNTKETKPEVKKWENIPLQGYPSPAPFLLAPITTQPTGQEEVPAVINSPQRPPSTPPGLQHLETLDQLLIYKQTEATGICSTKASYQIQNASGQKLYLAFKNSACCTTSRFFNMDIVDANDTEVIRLEAPLMSNACWYPCPQKIEVSSPPGTLLGTVQKEWTIWGTKFLIKNASGETALKIEGGCINGCNVAEFTVRANNGVTPVGTIIIDNGGGRGPLIEITLPMNLDVNMKAAMIGASFLIVWMTEMV